MGNLQFDWTQKKELDLAREKGLDISVMENPLYLAEQMQEIRLGLEEGLDVSIYAKPEFDWFQMEQIRLGLIDKADVAQYARPGYDFETMKQLRLAMYSQVNLDFFLERGFRGKELKEIRLALEKEYPIGKWLSDDMNAQQINQIRTGLSEGLDVGRYAHSEYNWLQMQEIRKGLEERIDISLYTKSLFNHKQMQEIRYGLEAGIDVSSYAKLLYTNNDMKKIRWRLVKEKEEIEPRKLISAQEKSDREINIIVEDNGSRVYIFLPWKSGKLPDKEEIIDELKIRGIKYGINEDEISRMLRKKLVNTRVLAAEGKPARDGRNGWYEFFVRTDMPHIPKRLPDGSVDYTNIDAFEMVKEGQKIAQYHPAEEGTPGINVFGEEIPPMKGKEQHTLKGEGFMLSQDKMTCFAKKSGKFEYIDGRIEISKMIVIKEDVTGIFGQIDIDGSVHVIGSVHSGAYIRATGDIIIEHNAQAAKLMAKGNILIKRGSCSKNECYIEAGGEVSGNFFEAATIVSNKNIRANYIMNSNIAVMGKVIIHGNKGVLMGGRICAVQGIETFNLGNETNIKTILDIGKNERFHTKLRQWREQREKILQEISIFHEGQKRLIAEDYKEERQINTADILRKIEIGIKMKEQELNEIELKMKNLIASTKLGKNMPVLVKGKAYAGSVIIIDGITYILPQSISRVVFKKRNKNIIMLKP